MVLIIVLASNMVLAFLSATGMTLPQQKGGAKMAFSLESKDFKHRGEIPRKFTCEGDDTSPALHWSEPPAGTKSLALIADDPDAPMGTWVHWVVYDLEPGLRELPAGMAKAAEIKGFGKQGVNDFRKVGYGGPCPPPGKPHRYFFKLYALDARLTPAAPVSKKNLEAAMQGHVLAQAELIGLYKR